MAKENLPVSPKKDRRLQSFLRLCLYGCYCDPQPGNSEPFIHARNTENRQIRTDLGVGSVSAGFFCSMACGRYPLPLKGDYFTASAAAMPARRPEVMAQDTQLDGMDSSP